MTGVRELRDPPRDIESIVVIGSTCVGKTTLVNAVRAAALPGVDVPVRLVTRAQRADDVAEEARCVTSAELDAHIAAGRIAMHWSRAISGERYAFVHPARGAFAVFSANNAICRGVAPASALERALIVGVFAPDDVREARLRARSPALVRERPDEVRARLAERGDAVLPLAHVVIENHAGHEATAAQVLVDLVRARS